MPGFLARSRKKAGGTFAENILDEDDILPSPPTNFVLRGREKIGERETTAIEFEVKLRKDRSAVAVVALWLDAKTSLPVQRHVTLRMKDLNPTTMHETIQRIIVDGEVDAAAFVLPKAE